MFLNKDVEDSIKSDDLLKMVKIEDSPVGVEGTDSKL